MRVLPATFKYFILFLVYACSHPASESSHKLISPVDSATIVTRQLIKKSEALLMNGDLVTRSDDDFESFSLQNFSQRDRTYSHSGIVFFEDGIWMVYHSMGGTENPSGDTRRDPFDSFVNPIKKTGFGIFRYQLSQVEASQMHQLYQQYFKEKKPFDKSFNLKSDDSMYCSELIYKSLKLVTSNRINLPISTIENFKPKFTAVRSKQITFKRFEYVGMDDLYLNSFCRPITRVRYN